jgi:hypothetical protein
MIPKFSSKNDLCSFIKAIPANVNYALMLKNDFGIVDSEPTPLSSEYMWKYMLYKTVITEVTGKTFNAPTQADIDSFIAEHPDFASKEIKMPKIIREVKPEENVIPKIKPAIIKREAKRVSPINAPDGVYTVWQNPASGRWNGYIGSKEVTSMSEKEKTIRKLVNSFGAVREHIVGV